MSECPNCHSHDAVSKGYAPNGNKRYVCKMCKRNYTESTLPSKIQEEVDSTIQPQRMTTLQVSEDVKIWIESLKLCKQESNNAALIRLRDTYLSSKNNRTER